VDGRQVTRLGRLGQRWRWAGAAALIFLAAAAVLFSTWFDDTAWARVQQRGIITFATDPTYPPFETLGPDGQFSGFDIDLAQALAGRLGVKAEFESVSYDGLIGTLVTQRDDALISAWVIQPERGQEASFTPAYFNAGVLLVTRSDAVLPAGAQSWATGKHLTAELGSSGDALERKWARLVAGLTPDPAPDAAEALKRVADGAADGALVDAVAAYEYLKTAPGLKVAAAIPEADAPYVMAVSIKSRVLLRQLTQALSAMEADGFLGALRAKWFGEAAR
jgi:cystine transport system substrate-binding protein